MSASRKDIEEAARALTPVERAELAEALIESLRSPLSDIEAAWAQEIEQRVSASDRGEVPSYAAEDVFAEARRLSR